MTEVELDTSFNTLSSPGSHGEQEQVAKVGGVEQGSAFGDDSEDACLDERQSSASKLAA